MEMRASVTTELKTLDDDGKPVYGKNEKQDWGRLMDLGKIIERPENTVSVFQIRNNKELLRFILALSSLSLKIRKLSMTFITNSEFQFYC